MNKFIKTFSKCLLLVFALLLVYRLYFACIVTKFISEPLDIKQMLINSRILPNAIMLFLIALWMRVKKVSFHELGFVKMQKEGFVDCFYFLPIVGLLLVIFLTMQPYAPMDVTMWIMVLIEIFLIAIIEEVIFRGIIYRALLPYGNLVTLFGTAILFTIAHIGSLTEISSVNNELVFYLLSSILFYFTVSLMFSYIRYNAKSIIPCIVYHVLHNLIVVNTSFDVFYLIAFFTAYAYAMHVYNKRKERIV